MGNMNTVIITVTVDQAHLGVVTEVAERLRTRGMVVEQVLDSVGIITGSVPRERCFALNAVEGVDSVDEQHRFRIPPPDAEVQ